MPSRKLPAKGAPNPTVAERLAAVPLRNVRVEVTEGGAVATLTVPLTYPRMVKPFAGMLGLKRRKSYQLEGLGLEVWRLVDGTATVGSMVDWLAQQHRLSFHEARALIMRYLQTLTERGLVVIAGFAAPDTGTSVSQ